MKMMNALVVEGVKELIYKEIPVPTVGSGEVLIKVHACGICGSDVPRVRDGGVHAYPIVVGHEFSGEIVRCGDDVQGLQIGDRVTAAPLIPCGSCEECSKGRPAMCMHYSFVGSRQDGAFAEYVVVPAHNIVPLADSISYEHAACIEPITVAIHGVERVVHLDSGASAIVYGCGTIGILTLQCLRAKGVERIYVIDIDAEKLALAQKLGAYKTLNSLNINIPMYFKEHGKVDYAFETAGVNVLQAQILELVKKTGTVVYIGTAPRDVTFSAENFELILRNELNVTGSWMSYSAPFPGHEWIAAVEYLQSGKVKVDDIVTHTFPLQAGYKAFDTLLDKEQKALKVMYVIE